MMHCTINRTKVLGYHTENTKVNCMLHLLAAFNAVAHYYVVVYGTQHHQVFLAMVDYRTSKSPSSAHV